MNEADNSDTQAPVKRVLHPDNLKKGSIAGAVIAAIASLGYAEIQREENETLLRSNTELVRIITSEAQVCRDLIIKAYNRGKDANTEED